MVSRLCTHEQKYTVRNYSYVLIIAILNMLKEILGTRLYN
jgi:hypothetical protein